MPVTTCRFTDEAAKRLRELAHLESLKTGTEITVSSLVRDCVDDYLRRVERRQLQAEMIPDE